MNKPVEEFGPDADEDLPEEVLDAISNGVTPLGAVRMWRRMSIENLAQASGVSEGVIRGAEGGRQLWVAARIALGKALGVGADLFVG
jgi:hypothetical protein